MKHALQKWRTGMLALAMAICLPASVFAQEVTVSGTVTDGETGDALPGVSVMVKGTSSGTATDVSGKYSLSTSSGSTLVFSFIGYSSQEVAVGNQTNINVALAVDFTELQEIVVVGYGTQEKRDVTAAISTVSAQDVQELPVTSALAAMQGKVAGVDIQQRSGRPGENATIKIRGRRSINASNEPLYVVDGVPLVSGGSISDINQADIKSIEVLKDAAATAIYGSRGANGVILITTNRGESGQAKVSYNGYYGPTSIGTRVNIMDGYEFADMKRESRRVRIDPATNKPVYDYLGTIPTDAEIFEDPAEFASLTNNPAGIDYQDLIFNPGFRSSHQISISGGSEKTQYLMSANVYDELYPINTIDFHRKSFRLNLDQEIFDWLKVGTSTTITVTDQDYHGSSAINEAMRNNPLGNPWNADGTLAFKPVEDGIRTNPLLEVVPNAVIDNHLRSRFLASLYLDAKLAEGLNFRMTYGPDMRYRREARWRSSQTQVHKGGPPDARKIHRFNDAWILENLLTYNKEVASGHKLGLTFLQSAQESFYEYSVLEGKVLPTESFWNDIGSAESISADSDNTLWRMTSYMGRVNYSIADKYLLQATYRADANSVLAPGQKWSFFPGVSAGWRVIDEDFMQNVTAVSELKLRASYGKVGNSSIGPYQTWGGLSGTVYTWDGAPAKGYRLSNVPNPDLGWEYTETIDFGVDFGFMEGKISGSLDYYSSNTSDLLLRRQLPPTSGYDNILQNVGKTAGKGVELALSAVVMDNPGGFSWSVDLNWARAKERIVELADPNDKFGDLANRWFIGEPLFVHYDYRKEGIWQLNEVDEAAKYNLKPGEIKLEDVDGDGAYGTADRQILGTDVPNWQGGITNRMSYKDFDLMFFVYSRWGHMITSSFEQPSLFARYNDLMVDYWTPTNPTNSNPRPNQNQESPKYGGTRAYVDGSYIKLRTLQIGYNLPASLISAAKMQSARVYLTADNPWYFAKYGTFDPETDDPDISDAPSVGYGTLPATKAFLMGVQITF